MSAAPVRLVLKTPEFFAADPKKLRVEEDPVTDRIYFLKKDRIVAVAERSHEKDH